MLFFNIMDTRLDACSARILLSFSFDDEPTSAVARSVSMTPARIS